MTWLRRQGQGGVSDKVTFVPRSEDEGKRGQGRVGGKTLLGKDTAETSSE